MVQGGTESTNLLLINSLYEFPETNLDLERDVLENACDLVQASQGP